MTRKCIETMTAAGVSISCYATKCPLPNTDSSRHVTELTNNRSSNIYQVEICSVALHGLLRFNGAARVIARYGVIVSKSRAPTSVDLNPVGLPGGTEEILTTVEFYDATQRVGGNTFLGPKESYQIDYEIDLQ
jgi:hypothetical protein